MSVFHSFHCPAPVLCFGSSVCRVRAGLPSVGCSSHSKGAGPVCGPDFVEQTRMLQAWRWRAVTRKRKATDGAHACGQVRWAAAAVRGKLQSSSRSSVPEAGVPAAVPVGGSAPGATAVVYGPSSALWWGEDLQIQSLQA